MATRRHFTLGGLALALAGCGDLPQSARARFGLATARSRLAEQAAKEAGLQISATQDQQGLDDLLSAFRRQHPAITLDYHRPSSSDLHADFMRTMAQGRPTADILISSAMDLQFKLVNDGYALAYESPEKPYLPDWAVWKDQAFAITAEPIVFAYNRALMPPADIPSSHDALADLLRRKPDEYRGKIATYDPERSGTGYLYYTQDLLLSRDTLDLATAVGRTQPGFYALGGEAMNKVERGEHLLAYNMVGSQMLARQSRDPNVGIVFPSDYTLVMSRIAFIPKSAPHPAASRLFLDFLLSEPGQTLLAQHHMQPIRTGITMDGAAPAPDVLRPIHFGPSLLANLDEFRRQRVLREWRRTLAA